MFLFELLLEYSVPLCYYMAYVGLLFLLSLLPRSTAIPLPSAQDSRFKVQTCPSLIRDYALCMMEPKKRLFRSIRTVIALLLVCPLECIHSQEFMTFVVPTMSCFMLVYWMVSCVPKHLRMFSLIGLLLFCLWKRGRPVHVPSLDQFPRVQIMHETRRQVRGHARPNVQKSRGKNLGGYLLKFINYTPEHGLLMELLIEVDRERMTNFSTFSKDPSVQFEMQEALRSMTIVLKGSTALAVRCHTVLPYPIATLLCSELCLFQGGDVDMALSFGIPTKESNKRLLSKMLLYNLATLFNEKFEADYVQCVRERVYDAFRDHIVVCEPLVPSDHFSTRHLGPLNPDGHTRDVMHGEEPAPRTKWLSLTRNTICWTYNRYASFPHCLLKPLMFHLDRMWVVADIRMENERTTVQFECFDIVIIMSTHHESYRPLHSLDSSSTHVHPYDAMCLRV